MKGLISRFFKKSQNVKIPELIVIGGGTAGLMAAGQAACLGKQTLILEKKHTAARKLRITGKGRCNITNIAEIQYFIEHIFPNGRFLRNAFSRFFNTELIDFFEQIGVKTVVERGGRVFPASGDAKEVAQALINWNRRNNVVINYSGSVDKIIVENGSVAGVLSRGKIYKAKAVILATGGASYPLTGSTGDGYNIARDCGHTIVPIRPALVPLQTENTDILKAAGLELKNVNVGLWIDNKRVGEEFGEMTITKFGVSGPVILTLSLLAVDAINKNQQVELAIDFKPALDYKKLNNRILRELQSNANRNFHAVLQSLLPKVLISVFIQRTGISPEKPCHQISSNERKNLLKNLKEFKLKVSNYRLINEAIVTAGGVSLKEINPATMESKIVKNLYFAGEVIDLHGDTGGFNLQIAFTTGWLAGIAAVQ